MGYHKPHSRYTMAKASTQDQHVPGTIENIDELMENLTKAISHLSFAPTRRLHFFELPQEIQDIIFNLANPPVNGFKALTKFQWEGRELTQRRTNGKTYTYRPFPSEKASEFLVSKRYFVSASRAFVSHQVFDADFMAHIIRSHKHCIILPYVTKAHLPSCLPGYNVANIADFLPNLRSLTITIDHWDYEEAVPPGFAWEDELSSKEVLAVVTHLRLDRVVGLKDVRIIPSECMYAKSLEQEATWKRNAGKVEDLTRAFTTRMRMPGGVSSLRGAAALYPGSSVSVTSSAVSQEESTFEKDSGQRQPPKLKLQDIPSDSEDLVELIKENPERVMNLMNSLKRRERWGHVNYML